MKRALFLAIAIGVPSGVLFACKHETPTAEQGGGRGGSRGIRGDGGLLFAVDTLLVKAQKVDYLVNAPGTIEAFERVQVTSRVSGAVDRVAFAEGQEVHKGDVLVIIDSQRYQLAVNSAKANLEKAQAAQKDVEGQVSRREGAMDAHPGLIPGEELATYRTRTLTAKADTAVATENLKTAELNLRDSNVRAPMDGIIQTRTIETGQFVNAGALMATLLRQDPMLLRFAIEPQEAPRLKPGMIADFTMRETQRAFRAKITLVAAAADATTRMVAVTGEVLDAEEHKYWLRPGSFCDVSVNIGATRDAPIIPRGAMRATDHGYVVYVVENDTAAERVVTTGMSTRDGWIEIKDGLKDGDWIVVRGGDALSPGAKVKANRLLSMDAGAEPLDDTAGGDAGRRRGDGGAARGPRGAGSGAPAQ
ncbi:MAG: efflux RND transporter periplasmic adaptor subunit [Labilithrix sp.]|nr:efflux RND transporter periplasmic adaptor subunit [Labilithrix sp.]MCW5818171.1 efflux RND transporter periplasmic adaptor subunit [Labilithrix sp.]